MYKIYLSTFAVNNDIVRNPNYKNAMKLLELLKNNNYEIINLLKFTSYDNIEKTILKCDCLLAFVDEYWTSSTWKCMEVTYANGEAGSGITDNKRIDPIPVFLYYINPYYKSNFLDNYKGPVRLPNNYKKAYKIINNHMQ